MSKIIKLFQNELTKNDKNKYRFVTRETRILDIYGNREIYPNIILIEKETALPVWYTGYEYYICDYINEVGKKQSTLSKRSKAICEFLNYILWETDIKSVSACSVNVIKNYLEYIKYEESGEVVKRDTWHRKRNTVINFLINFYRAQKNNIEFLYCENDLISIEESIVNGRSIVRKVPKGLGIKLPPKNRRKKNRVLMYGYLDKLIYEAMKYDPDIVLAIALQAYAGLREGEVVNLTCNSYKEYRRGFDSLQKIVLDLTKDAPFFLKWDGKTNPGSIKKYRAQEVYVDFINRVCQLHKQHIQLLELKGYETTGEHPLFRNHQGKPLTVSTYSNRVKKLFYDHFLPGLKEECDKSIEVWTENKPYIESYEAEYPGAHMLRHWFTMYLLTKAKLRMGEIAQWRGDSSQEAMMTYISLNNELKREYEECTYAFHKELLEDVIRNKV